MIVTVVPIFVAILGALVWAFAGNPKLAEMGKWLFVVGVFYTVGALAHVTWRLG